MKRLARSTGEQRQNCFPPLLFLSGGGRKKKRSAIRRLFMDWGETSQIWRAGTHVCLIRLWAFMGKRWRKSARIPRCAQPILPMTCVKSKYESDDKSRDEKEWNASKGGGGEETNMRNCRHFSLSAVSLHVHFFLPPSLSQPDGRTGGGGGESAYHNSLLLLL